ncbi:hypothetical protein SVA_1109 [Sulfurifustis variabilis]|uniref:Uncharacterized protein n=1 Tax=Sulfurifustis variabilis TaxID=1675686 RepID=A0A1B4V2E0_9GAMM|nr:PP0621 family protein [Sulfurifustis variabilis]BAU47686.1 hypothetical protein SVA_1109 [Sulfurifustis variabilis]
MGQLVRIIVIAILIWLAIRLVRSVIARYRGLTERPHRPAVPRMLPCAHCGLHVPEHEAIVREGAAYCSEEHYRAAHR